MSGVTHSQSSMPAMRTSAAAVGLEGVQVESVTAAPIELTTTQQQSKKSCCDEGERGA